MYKQIAGVYLITNLKSHNRTYVGSSAGILERWAHHRVTLNSGRHRNIKLQRAWKKYGADAFHFNIIEEVADHALLLEREQYWIDTLEPFYNIALVAGGGRLGRKHTPEAIAKMSEIARNRTPRSGWTHSPEARARMADAQKIRREKHPIVISDAQKAKISASLKGRKKGPLSAEWRAKISAAGKGNQNWLGKKHTPETLAKISAAKKGNKYNLGKKASPETRAKSSAAHKAALQKRNEQKIRASGYKQPSLWGENAS